MSATDPEVVVDSSYPDPASFAVLPKGSYSARLDRYQVRRTKIATWVLHLWLQIAEGRCKGRVLAAQRFFSAQVECAPSVLRIGDVLRALRKDATFSTDVDLKSTLDAAIQA